MSLSTSSMIASARRAWASITPSSPSTTRVPASATPAPPAAASMGRGSGDRCKATSANCSTVTPGERRDPRAHGVDAASARRRRRRRAGRAAGGCRRPVRRASTLDAEIEVVGAAAAPGRRRRRRSSGGTSSSATAGSRSRPRADRLVTTSGTRPTSSASTSSVPLRPSGHPPRPALRSAQLGGDVRRDLGRGAGEGPGQGVGQRMVREVGERLEGLAEDEWRGAQRAPHDAWTCRCPPGRAPPPSCPRRAAPVSRLGQTVPPAPHQTTVPKLARIGEAMSPRRPYSRGRGRRAPTDEGVGGCGMGSDATITTTVSRRVVGVSTAVPGLLVSVLPLAPTSRVEASGEAGNAAPQAVDMSSSTRQAGLVLGQFERRADDERQRPHGAAHQRRPDDARLANRPMGDAVHPSWHG